MKKIALSFLVLLMSVVSMAAKNITAQRGTVKNSYNYWLYQPEDAETDTIGKPVIIFLHGASLCGNDLNKVRRYGTIDAIERGRKLDAYVIAPQNPGGAWNPRKIMDILDFESARHRIDSTRVYVMGMSLGGYGTIDVAATYPERIAAAIAMCGGGSVNDYSGLSDVPLWIIHGTADRAVNVSQSDKVVEQIRRTDHTAPRLIYNRVPGMNHAQPARMFYLQESYDWLLSHSLNDDDRPVADTFDIAIMRNAYAGLAHNGKSYKSSKKSRRHRATRTSRKRRRR